MCLRVCVCEYVCSVANGIPVLHISINDTHCGLVPAPGVFQTTLSFP